MKIHVRYFASLREALGEQQVLENVAEGCTVALLRDHLRQSSPVHAQALAAGRAVRCAVNQVMAQDQTVIPPQAEVAFFPPVTGG